MYDGEGKSINNWHPAAYQQLSGNFPFALTESTAWRSVTWKMRAHVWTNLPVYLHLGSLRLHPHVVFEALAYAIGFRVYLWLRSRTGDTLDDPKRNP